MVEEPSKVMNSDALHLIQAVLEPKVRPAVGHTKQSVHSAVIT
jgi:hypothetical protein